MYSNALIPNRFLRKSATKTVFSPVSPSKKIKLIEAPPADPPKPVSELTDAERLKLRAEKYGVNTSKGALSSKEARAARFGTAADKKAASPAAAAKVADVAAAAKVPKNVSAEDLEKMKQRGARFGATVSTTMSSVDNVDKILKRKERFGEVAATTTGKDRWCCSDKLFLSVIRFDCAMTR